MTLTLRIQSGSPTDLSIWLREFAQTIELRGKLLVERTEPMQIRSSNGLVGVVVVKAEDET
jgi:hypothetical protein